MIASVACVVLTSPMHPLAIPTSVPWVLVRLCNRAQNNKDKRACVPSSGHSIALRDDAAVIATSLRAIVAKDIKRASLPTSS